MLECITCSLLSVALAAAFALDGWGCDQSLAEGPRYTIYADGVCARPRTPKMPKHPPRVPKVPRSPRV